KVSAVCGLTLLFTLFLTTALDAQEVMDEATIFQQAVEQNRPILLIFSGSDWCAPCIRFNRQVLSDSSVDAFLHERVIIVHADFPQRTTLPDNLVERNERLAERYNPNGDFPRVLLVNPDKSVRALLTHAEATPASFIEEVKRYINSKPEPSSSVEREFRASALLMGSAFEFTIVASDSLRATKLLQQSIEEIRRIEYLLSEWIDTSQTSQLNNLAGKGSLSVAPELYDLLKRSLAISRLTQGAFDVSFAGAGKLWKFDGTQRALPDSATVLQAVENVGFEKIQLLDSTRVFLKREGMRIGFGSIGKGYAAERVAKMLKAEGVRAGVINASGDLRAWGTRPDGSAWRVGIANPKDRSEMILWLPIKDGAVATSGNYEKFFELNGVRYAHIIDPRTGWPAQGVKSVTIISPSAELSDALATGVFVLGVEVGLDLIEQLPDVECIIIDSHDQIFTSSDIDVHADALGQIKGGR
ncbi:MAG: FAD:protein FMN transferase, partial [Candidatus Kapaibacterium sp.]